MGGFKLSNASFLRVGQAFRGSQNINQNGSFTEAWKVNVRVQGFDLEKGYICGSMEAINVPMTQKPVVTFWEGEIVDNTNHGFVTGKWDATKDSDLDHWRKFDAFRNLSLQEGGWNVDLSKLDYVFMRWKEKFFVNVEQDCGLTIAGFYYVCLERSTGKITGYYFDPNSTPFQRLDLQVCCESRRGHAFPSYSFN
eukprot:Rmarinus@m.17196